MNHHFFGLAMMGKGLFAGAALAIVLQGGERAEADSMHQPQPPMVKIQRIQSTQVHPAGLPAAGSEGTLTPSQVATSQQPSWVF